MHKKRVTEMRVNENTYGEIMKRTSESYPFGDAKYRSMLVSLKPGCYVETSDNRGGDIAEIERDRYDIPVRVKASYKIVDKDGNVVGEHSEWIDVEDIYFWEAWDFIAPSYLFEDDNYPVGELMFESEVL